MAGHHQQQAVVVGHEQQQQEVPEHHHRGDLAIFLGKYQVYVLAFDGFCPLSPRMGGGDHAKGT